MYQEILNLILKRIDFARDPVFSADEVSKWPKGCLELFIKRRILEEIEPAKTVECDGCDEKCIEEVEYISHDSGRSYQGYVVCDKRDDVGRIPVLSERLRQWQMCINGFIHFLADSLGIKEHGYNLISNRLWWLGRFEINNIPVDCYFIRGLMWKDAEKHFSKAEYFHASLNPIIFTASISNLETRKLPFSKNLIGLPGIFKFHDSELSVDNEVLRDVIVRIKRFENLIINKYPTPEGAQWKDMTIHFISYREIRIIINGDAKERTFNDLGFVDRRKSKDLSTPNQLWDIFADLAQLESSKGLTSEIRNKKVNPKKCRKQISRLGKQLCNYFGIDESPFYDYRSIGHYKPKFALKWIEEDSDNDAEEGDCDISQSHQEII